jgi:hypothetical protein
MKSTNQVFAASVLALALNCGNVLGQPVQPAQPAQPGQPGQGQQRMDWANFDPQQIQQTLQKRIMDNLRQQLAITNDAEWTVIEERLSKVSQMRTESTLSTSMGLLGGMRSNATGRGGGMGGMGGMGGLAGLMGLASSDPALESLQQSVDNNAPKAQLKQALEELREKRKQKQADLAKAQDDLRSILTTRQEAILVLAGMLD